MSQSDETPSSVPSLNPGSDLSLTHPPTSDLTLSEVNHQQGLYARQRLHPTSSSRPAPSTTSPSLALSESIRSLRTPSQDFSSPLPSPSAAGRGPGSNPDPAPTPSRASVSSSSSSANSQQAFGFPNGSTSSSPKASSFRLHPQNSFVPRSYQQSGLAAGDLSRPPRERLDAYLGTKNSQQKVDSAVMQAASPRDPRPVQAISPRSLAPSSLAQRSATSPSLLSQSSSPPSSPYSMAPSATATQAELIARKSSVDSAISSMSSSASASVSHPSISTNHSHQSSQETPSSLEVHPAALIKSCGSSEQAVLKLQQELRQSKRQYDRLWDLTQKQRDMIRDFNKEHEKAMKDISRYRKRTKELEERNKELNAAVSAQTALQALPTASSRLNGLGNDQKDAGVSAQSSLSLEQSRNGSDAVDTTSFKPPKPLSISTDLADDNQVPGHHGTFFDHSKTESIISQSTSNSIPETVSLDNDPRPGSTEDLAPGQQKSSQFQSPTTPKAQASDSSFVSPGEKSRKPAPAPLNLSKAQPPASLQLPRAPETESKFDNTSEDSSSEYENDASSALAFERGRKRTREEDNRRREAAALVEEEQRSKSSKSDTSKSKPPLTKSNSNTSNETVLPHSQSEAAAQSVGMKGSMGLPSSPRAAFSSEMQSPIKPMIGSMDSALAGPGPTHDTPHETSSQQVFAPPISPGLPLSPRPKDRPSNSASPRVVTKTIVGPGPASPTSSNSNSLSPRLPRQPVPAPLSAKSATFPTLRSDGPSSSRSQNTSMAERLQQGFAPPSRDPHPLMVETTAEPPSQIYEGFKTDLYPGLLLPPSSFDQVIIKVFSSRLRPIRAGAATGRSFEDTNLMILSVHMKSDDRQLWRVEKTVRSLLVLNDLLYRTKFSVPFPGIGMFHGQSPRQLEDRRISLNEYFQNVLSRPLEEEALLTLADFFSRDLIEPAEPASPFWASEVSADETAKTTSKEKLPKVGYLAKKGKNFGGWKARYYKLFECEMQYFDTEASAQTGTIKLRGSYLETHNTKDRHLESEYKNGFTIVEPKRRDPSSVILHTLCAESPEECQSWMEAIRYCLALTNPNLQTSGEQSSPSSPTLQGRFSESVKRKDRNQQASSQDSTPQFAAINYDDTVARAAPTISGIKSGGPIQNSSQWGIKSSSPSRVTNKLEKKRSMFSFIKPSSEDSSSSLQPPRSSGPGLSPQPPSTADRRSPLLRPPVFGVHFSLAVAHSGPIGAQYGVPSPVYRCLEYFQANNASDEEGIFRISGSNSMVVNLRAKFQADGDVDLLEEKDLEVHAVTSLLKKFFMESGDALVQEPLATDFMKALELQNPIDKTSALRALVNRLPPINREILRMISHYLIEIVEKSDRNLMTLSNIGTVTQFLNVNVNLLKVFITGHAGIFVPAVDGTTESLMGGLRLDGVGDEL